MTAVLTMLMSPLAIMAVAVLIGFSGEKVLLPRLARTARTTPWIGDDLLLAALRGQLLLWCVLTGLQAALAILPLPAATTLRGTQLLEVVFLLSLTLVAMRLAVGYVRYLTRTATAGMPATTLFITLTRLAVGTAGILVVFASLGISVAPALTALGVGGLAVAIALQDTLTNLFAGLQIIASRQILPGELVRLENGQEGTISDITWRTTTLVTVAGDLVIVPNSKLAATTLVNLSRPAPEHVLSVPLCVAYGSDLALVEQIAREVAQAVQQEQGIDGSDLRVMVNALGDSGINLTVPLRVRSAAAGAAMRHAFLTRLLAQYAAAGITIPIPARAVLLPASRPPQG